jgi:hypothetical protein
MELKINQVWRGLYTKQYVLIIQRGFQIDKFNLLSGKLCKDSTIEFRTFDICEGMDGFEFISDNPQVFWNSIRNQRPYG